MSKSIFLDEIVSIREIGIEKTIDITVTGNNLFFANGILTHNSGYDNSDIGLENMSESAGLNSTADLVLGLIRSEELDQLNQIMVKQLKNRFGDISTYKRFVVGVDRAKMRLYDIEDSAQENVVDNGFEKEDNSRLSNKYDKKKFNSDYSGLKV